MSKEGEKAISPKNSNETVLWVGLQRGRKYGALSEVWPARALQGHCTLDPQWQTSMCSLLMTATVSLLVICGLKQSTDAVGMPHCM